MNKPLVSDFNFLGVGDPVRQVLQWNFESPEGVDHFADLLLKHLVQTAEAKEGDLQATWLDD